VRKIHGKYPIFSGRCVGQRNSDRISVYDFAYVRCNRAQYFPQVQAGRDAGRQIQEQVKPLVLTLKFCFYTHGLCETPPVMMIEFALKSQRLVVTAGITKNEAAGC
jgi:hypothetical protein